MAGPNDNASAPMVPFDTILAGRQATVRFLLSQVDHAQWNFSGRSLNIPWTYVMDRKAMRGAGYNTPGSFDQISKATASQPFSAEVIPTPENYYDVSVELTYYNTNNVAVLHGYGQLDIEEGPAGTLVVKGDFSPYVYIPWNLQTTIPGACGDSVRFIGRNWGGQQDLNTECDGTDAIVTLELGMLEDGNLLVSNGNDTWGYSLNGGGFLQGQRVWALIGQSSSSEVRVASGFNDLVGNTVFYSNNGWMLYGRMPVGEINLLQGFTGDVTIEVPVYGAHRTIRPTSVTMTKLQKEGSPLSSKRIEVPFDATKGTWKFSAPAGIYQIECTFPSVNDFDQYGGGEKG